MAREQPKIEFPYPPRRINVELVGATPLYKARERLKVVDALCSEEKLTPELWAIHERGAEPFDRKKFQQYGNDPGPVSLHVLRKRQLWYELDLSIDTRPRLDMDFHPGKLKPANLPMVFRAGDLLAEAFRCDFGWVHLASFVRLPSPDPEDVTQKLMDMGFDPHHSYRDHGPGGLGFRTYLGPSVLKQIGKYVRSLPAPFVVRDLAWGGVSIDLLPEPWLADAKSLHTQWQAAMENFRPAKFFATPTVKSNGAVSWEKGAKCTGLFGVIE
jgi:hypothetical protein